MSGGYPSINEFNDAVQVPGIAFSDPVLKQGKIKVNGLGLPVALGGGFALTYSVETAGRRYAVRCFHKSTNGLEGRYASISQSLRAAASPYFVGFEYQREGILVSGRKLPIVRMDWAKGDTLGAYLEASHGDGAAMARLQAEFRALEAFLRSKGMAHGDIQSGNVLVDRVIRLIDYDGFYVPGMSLGQGAELGQKHFQHPRRSAADFGPAMDRFSFIAIDLGFRALEQDPSLFREFSNGENLLFTASDYADPGSSVLLSRLRAIAPLARDAENFASVCAAPAAAVPRLDDFLAARGIPNASIVIARTPLTSAAAVYIGAYPVVDAADFAEVLRVVGDKVEMVGRIVEVKVDKTRRGYPYVFLNFGPWRGQIAKVSIWSEGLRKLRMQPDKSWEGRWVSVTGLVDEPYSNKRYGYTHLSITLAEANQLRVIDEHEARRRLSGLGAPQPGMHTAASNRHVLEQLATRTAASPPSRRMQTQAAQPKPAPTTANQAILDSITPVSPGIRSIASQPSRPVAPSPGYPNVPPPPPPSRGFPRWVWWGVALAAFLIFRALK